MNRALTITLCALLLVLPVTAAWSDGGDASRRDSRAQARRNLKSAATEVGHATRDLAKATGKEAARVGHRLDDATREPRREAGHTGEGLWNEVSNGIAEALRDVAAFLRDAPKDAK